MSLFMPYDVIYIDVKTSSHSLQCYAYVEGIVDQVTTDISKHIQTAENILDVVIYIGLHFIDKMQESKREHLQDISWTYGTYSQRPSR